ncbi:MAG: dynamin family protein, partial [Oscillospiraceae bacterium]|nr:dynamin family protein [Oscillospiraceae bacterium]
DEDSGVIFIYSGEQPLYNYIDKLNNKGNGLDDEYLYQFKVCYEYRDRDQPDRPLEMSYSSSEKKAGVKVLSMKELIGELDGKSSCRIVIESNDRIQLAFVVQQLIYIEYPLETVDILLRREEGDAAKTKRFMENVDELLSGCEKAICGLEEMRSRVAAEEDNPTKADRLKDIDDTLASCRTIFKKVDESVHVDLKFAVAATKKAGKSVIVDCFLGEEIAPTSTELATPNNCIYRKSSDGRYHLQLMDGSEPLEDEIFTDRAAIHDKINQYFREAQDDKESGFSLGDMHIQYVTEENNFSSYTIYDTAGPNAAGTSHREAAERAMQQCDVAVFAIDYAKHLSDDEEAYLHHVKEMFTRQNKFHSLMFALNKIDVRYTDTEEDTPKSFIKSVDYMKKRLSEIDEAYRDCIIFPTSSKEYFCTLEAEKAGASELEQGLTAGEINKLAQTYKKDKKAASGSLNWLSTHAFNLNFFHGIENFTYDVFRKDSGMPALMSYVSYVARSKAREEIVNNITYEIASQKVKIQSVLDYMHNLEVLINANDEKIAEISRIIGEYSSTVERIFSKDFNSDDFEDLEEDFGGNSLLKIFETYDNMIAHQRKAVEASCDRRTVADGMYSMAVDRIWDNLNKHLKKHNGEIARKHIDKLFQDEDFSKITNKFLRKKALDAAGDAKLQLSRVSREVKTIVEGRQERLRAANELCKDRLSKEDIYIELPEIPDFEFSAVMPPLDKINVNIQSIDLHLFKILQKMFKKSFFSNIGNYFLSLFGVDRKKDFKYKLEKKKKDFYKVCDDKLKDKFKNGVYENNVPEMLSEQVCRAVIDEYVLDVVNMLDNTFEGMNSLFQDCVLRFKQTVDDRDTYKEEIELHNMRKANINEISGCTASFMRVWNLIVKGLEEAAEPETVTVSQ